MAAARNHRNRMNATWLLLRRSTPNSDVAFCCAGALRLQRYPAAVEKKLEQIALNQARHARLAQRALRVPFICALLNNLLQCKCRVLTGSRRNKSALSFDVDLPAVGARTISLAAVRSAVC
jgi:hypothetical protein